MTPWGSTLPSGLHCFTDLYNTISQGRKASVYWPLTINLRFFLPFLIAHSIVPYFKTLLVFLLHSNLSNATIQILNCFILLERHNLETISFVTSCFIVHEERLNLRVVLPSRGYCFSDYSLLLLILPNFAVHAATIRTRSLFH